MSIEIGGVEVLSLDEVSKRLGVEPDALKRCIRHGELVARRIGDQWFVTSQNLLNFLQTPASPSKRTQKHHRAEEPAPVPAPEAAPPPEPPTLPEERIVSAAPGAALKSAEPPPTPLPAPARPPETGITKPETVFAHELPPIPVETAAPPAPPAPPLPTLQATEPLMPSLPSAPVPGVAESEKPTDLNVPTVPLPPHLAAPPRESPAKPPSEPGEALAALFDMPLLPPDAPVMASLNAQAPQEDPAAAAAEARKAAAIEATRRRATLPAPGAIPGDGRARRTLLDSEEMPAVPPEAAAAATATATKTAEPTGARLSDIPNMFGPDSPTVLLTPEQVEADAARTKKLLMEAVEQGRVAQKARDEIVATVRKLPLEEQSFALAGPIGEQLVKLDHMIEEGVRAQKELGLPAAPAVPEVVTAVNKPPAAAEPSKWVPMGEQAPADPVPLIVPPSDPAIPVAAPVRPAGERKPTSRVGPVGGETWQEVGLPVPRHAHPAPPASPGIARLTLSLNDEEKRLLSDRGIAEDTAVQEIMRRFQPTDEKGWSEAKGRYFGPLRGKGSVKA